MKPHRQSKNHLSRLAILLPGTTLQESGSEEAAYEFQEQINVWEE